MALQKSKQLNPRLTGSFTLMLRFFFFRKFELARCILVVGVHYVAMKVNCVLQCATMTFAVVSLFSKFFSEEYDAGKAQLAQDSFGGRNQKTERNANDK